MFILLVMLLAWAIPAGGTPPTPAPIREEAIAANDRFGVCHLNSVEVSASHSPSRIEERYQRALAAGAAWTRWPMYWPEIETSPGSFYYSAIDSVVLADLAHGLKVNAILLNTPVWYASGGIGASEMREMPRVERKLPISCYMPGGQCPAKLDVSPSVMPPPLNLYEPIFIDQYGNGTDIPGPGKSINQQNYWARFVYNMVSRYRPGSAWLTGRGVTPDKGIRYWEMWNEPDFPEYFWNGTVAEYYRLLKVGYLTAKAADPEAVVLMGGLMRWRLPGWFGQLLDLMRDDASPISGYWPYFDVLPWHWYSTASDLYWKTLWARTQLSSHGLPIKPIWVNETNAPVWNDYPGDGNEGDYKATMEEGASFIIQASAWGFAAGVERIFVHQLYDDGTSDFEAFGLVRNFADAPVYPYNGTTRPSYAAYQAASSYLTGLTSPQRTNHGTWWEELSFINGSGQRVRVVWATVGTAVAANVLASATQATLIGQDGATSTIYPTTGGYYSLTLPGASNYNNPGLCTPEGECSAMIGGKPYILVEYSDQVAPTSRVETLPLYSPTSFRVKWGGTDSGSGVASYEVLFRDGANPWQVWLTGTAATAAVFTGQVGHSYYFASRATDRAGNQEAYPQNPQASTTVAVALVGGVYDSRGGQISGAQVVITDGVGLVRRARAQLDASFRAIPLPRDIYQAQAQARNFGHWPARRNIDLVGQDLAQVDFYLPPRDNLVRDGGFEGALTASWLRSGSTPAMVTSTALSGSGALLLGKDLVPDTGTGGNSTIRQTITIPASMEQPILSFMYRLETQEVAHNDGFEVLIIYRDAQGHPCAYYLPNNQQQYYWQAGDWKHVHHDLSVEFPDFSLIRGQAIELVFNLWQSSFERPTLAWVDEVSVGSIPEYRYSFIFPVVRGDG